MPSNEATQPQPKTKKGRPSTGVTKGIVKTTVDKKILAEAKKVAFQNGETFAKFLSRAILSELIKLR